MKTIGISITKRILSPVSRGCKQNLTQSFFTIPILSILLYSACSSGGSAGANTETGPSGPTITITDYKGLKDIQNTGMDRRGRASQAFFGLKDIQNTGMDRHYRLGNDINAIASRSEGGMRGSSSCTAYTGSNPTAATCRGFEPIGNSGKKFTGRFDGDGHKITNLYINRSSTYNIGLFGYTGTSAEIVNIGVTNAYHRGQW